MSRKDEEDHVTDLGFRAKIIPANATGRRGRPNVRVVIDPIALLAADRPIHRLEGASDVNGSLHRNFRPVLSEDEMYSEIVKQGSQKLRSLPTVTAC